jgi:Zn-dependent protease with chaperone function
MKTNALKRSFGARVIALALVTLIAAPQAMWARYNPPHHYNMYSPEQDVQVGQQAAAEVYKKMPVLPENDPLTKYLQRIGNDLASHANAQPINGQKWPFNFHVIAQKDVNAFALPGGAMFVNVGTIVAADNEAQLAGVMAHEMSHVRLRHGTVNASKGGMLEALGQIAGGVLGNGAAGSLARLGTQIGVGSVLLKFSRDYEKEADLLGTDLMYDTGYNPQAMADFFKKLDAEGGARGPQFLSDHPNPGNRSTYVAAEVKTLPARGSYRGNSNDWASIKTKAGSTKTYTGKQIADGQFTPTGVNGPGSNGGSVQPASASTGSTAAAGIAPSGSYQVFEHNAYRIKYPDNWKVNGNTDSNVTIAPNGGLVDNGVAYGVILDGFKPQSSDIDSATRELIQSIVQGNPGMKQVGNPEEITVNGVHARSVDLVTSSPVKDSNGQPLKERDWLVALPLKNGEVLYSVFISTDKDYSKLQPGFENMLRSLKLK